LGFHVVEREQVLAGPVVRAPERGPLLPQRYDHLSTEGEVGIRERGTAGTAQAPYGGVLLGQRLRRVPERQRAPGRPARLALAQSLRRDIPCHEVGCVLPVRFLLEGRDRRERCGDRSLRVAQITGRRKVLPVPSVLA